MQNILNDNELINYLRKISFALKVSDEPAIYAVIQKVGCDLIFSEKSIGLSRAMRDVRLTIFLLSMAKENNIQGEKNAHWYEIYNAINLSTYPSRKIDKSTGIILKSIIEKKNSKIENFDGLSIEDFNDYDLELAVDFRKWSLVSEILNNLPTTKTGLYSWMNFLKMFVQRQRFISNASDEQNFSEIYKLIIDKLARIDVFKTSLNTIKLLYANSLQVSEGYQKALEFYEELDDANNSLAIIMEKARCYSKLTNYSDSIRHLDFLIEKLLIIYSDGGLAPLIIQNPADFNYSKNNAILAYSDIVSLAEISGNKLFMVSGTLLGYCRISDFLPNDKDLDFGLIGLDGLPKLIDLALKSGLFHINPDYLKGVDTIQVPFVHVQTGIWIDVFIYHENGEKFMTGVDFQFGYRQNFEFSKFEPIQVTFHNLKTYIPSNFDENLKENFLNWKTPDANYMSHVESPSIMNFGGVSHQMTVRFWLIRSIQSKSKEKFEKLMRVISDISGYDHGLSSQLIQSLIRYEILFSKF